MRSANPGAACCSSTCATEGRDSGAQSEPDNSGSTTLDLSPGLTFGVGAASTVYAYLQVPLYQKVNGIQLVPRTALSIGWTADF